MLISHRRRSRRLVPLLVATALILAMNSPGLAALASEAAAAEEPAVVRDDGVMPDAVEDVAEGPASAFFAEPDPEVPSPTGDEVAASEEAEPVTADAVMSVAAAALAPAAIEVQVLPYAAVSAVQLEGYTMLPHERWVNGDVKGYVEGEWVPFRLLINNTSGSAVAVQVPSMAYTVDHILGGSVAIDETRGWRWQVDSEPVKYYVSPDVDDDSDPMYLKTRLPEVADFSLDKGEIGYVYFEGHLAITQEWLASDGYLGASGYSGSSAQARLAEWNGGNAGDRTVSFPVHKEAVPTGSLTGIKFEDLDGNMKMDGDDHPLADWVFHLTYDDPAHTFSLTDTSTADGSFGWDSLPPGEYMLSEDPQPGYTLSTDLSQAHDVETGAVTGPVLVGNQPATVTKTWNLDLTADVPMADSFFVRYVIDDVPHDLDLPEEDGYATDTDVVWGTTIQSWQFFAMFGSEEVPLSGVLGPAETLERSRTNDFTFTPGVISGHKLIDDPTGGLVAGGADWEIQLYRNGVYYASAFTNGSGEYSFTGLLPGDYTLKEVEWDQYVKVWPEGMWLGPFTIASGSVFAEGTDFINAPRPIGIHVTKTANPTTVHVGDEITYTIDVENTGQVPVTLMTVTDPVLGVGNLLAVPVDLAPGVSLSDLDKEIVIKMAAPPDVASVHNIAIASGMTLLGPVSDDDSADVAILHPAIEVTKSVVEDSILDSDYVMYDVTVTNAGDATLTVDVIDYVDSVVHKVLDIGLVLGPGEHQNYKWSEAVSMPVDDTVVATGVDELGGEKGTVSDEASASVAVDVTKTFTLTLFEAMPEADSYFVRYKIGDDVIDLVLEAGADEYSKSVILPYGTVISEWQFFAMMGDEEIPLSGVLGPETLDGPLTNGFDFIPGRIEGLKYNDLDASGSQTGGELGMPGWRINLYRDGELYAWMDTLVDGSYAFSGLLPGIYTVEEVQLDGWEMTESPDREFVVGDESVYTGADFGNHHIQVTKTFSLTYLNAPAGAQFYVVYMVADGEPIRVDLEGEGSPYIGSDEIPWGDTIVEVWWMAQYKGHPIVLGIEYMEETITEPITNGFTYTASASGHKFDDIDGSTSWDKPDEPGLGDWTIGLYRMSMPMDTILNALPAPAVGYELYAQTVTAPDGSYSFTGLLPGIYYVAEELQDGWDQTVAPEGTFLIANGSQVIELDFGNMESFLPFTDTELEKSADMRTADPGGLVTYTLTYRLVADSAPTTVTIVDDYDERYMVPESTPDAIREDGKLIWHDDVPLEAGEERTIIYTMRVIEDMPEKATNIDNVAVIDPGGHEAKWRVTVSNPFLPFTGATLALLSVVAAAALLIGIVVRRKAHGV